MRKASGFRPVLLIAALGCCGCEGDRHMPGAPAPVQPAPSAPTTTVRIEGRVVDADTDRPIPGAIVRTVSVCIPEPEMRCSGLEGASATADENGVYVLTVDIPRNWHHMHVRVASAGYESEPSMVNPTVATHADVRLLRTLTIRPGESIDVQVFLGQYTCGDEGHLCRRVIVESAGKPIDLEVSSADGEVGVFAGPPSAHPFSVTSYPRRVTVPHGEVWIYAGGSKQRPGVVHVFDQRVRLVAAAAR
jgi:hypothetical protein